MFSVEVSYGNRIIKGVGVIEGCTAIELENCTEPQPQPQPQPWYTGPTPILKNSNPDTYN